MHFKKKKKVKELSWGKHSSLNAMQWVALPQLYNNQLSPAVLLLAFETIVL